MSPFTITFKRKQNYSMVFKVRIDVTPESGGGAYSGGTWSLLVF